MQKRNINDLINFWFALKLDYWSYFFKLKNNFWVGVKFVSEIESSSAQLRT